MKKEMTSRILLIALFSILLINLFAVVSAQSATSEPEGIVPALWKAFFGGIEKLWGGTEVSTTGWDWRVVLAEALMIALVTMIVYDITNLLPFFSSHETIKWIFSGAFGVLAFLFVDVKEIQNLALTYESVGVTLVAILPFIVIFAFTWKLDKTAENKTTPSFRFFASGIWLFFAAYLIFRWNELRVNSPSSPVLLAYAIFGVAALIEVFIHFKLYEFFTRFRRGKARQMGEKKEIYIAIRDLRNRNHEIIKAMENSENQTEVNELLLERKNNEKEIERLERELGFL